MIIFDLDGCLADCSHRRHYVDPELPSEYNNQFELTTIYNLLEPAEIPRVEFQNKTIGKKWKPNWDKFYEECDRDLPIVPVLTILSKFIFGSDYDVQIWSGRSESVRKKTIDWLISNWFIGLYDFEIENLSKKIKMRPVGDYTPDDQLKEKWLDEAIAEGKTIDMVFDESNSCCNMWRRRGIFVFDVNQTGKEF